MSKVGLQNFLRGFAATAAGYQQGSILADQERQRREQELIQNMLQASQLQHQGQLEQEQRLQSYYSGREHLLPYLTDPAAQEGILREGDEYRRRAAEQPPYDPYASIRQMQPTSGYGRRLQRSLPQPLIAAGGPPAGAAFPAGIKVSIRSEEASVAARDLDQSESEALASGDTETVERLRDLRQQLARREVTPMQVTKQMKGLSPGRVEYQRLTRALGVAGRDLSSWIENPEWFPEQFREQALDQAITLRQAIDELEAPNSPEKRQQAQALLRQIGAFRASSLGTNPKVTAAKEAAEELKGQRSITNMRLEGETESRQEARLLRQGNVLFGRIGRIEADWKRTETLPTQDSISQYSRALAEYNTFVEQHPELGLQPYRTGEFETAPQQRVVERPTRGPGPGFIGDITGERMRRFGLLPERESAQVPETPEQANARLMTQAAAVSENPEHQLKVKRKAVSDLRQTFLSTWKNLSPDTRQSLLQQYWDLADKAGVPATLPANLELDANTRSMIAYRNANLRLAEQRESRQQKVAGAGHTLSIEKQVSAALAIYQQTQINARAADRLARVDPSPQNIANRDRLFRELYDAKAQLDQLRTVKSAPVAAPATTAGTSGAARLPKDFPATYREALQRATAAHASPARFADLKRIYGVR